MAIQQFIVGYTYDDETGEPVTYLTAEYDDVALTWVEAEYNSADDSLVDSTPLDDVDDAALIDEYETAFIYVDPAVYEPDVPDTDGHEGQWLHVDSNAQTEWADLPAVNGVPSTSGATNGDVLTVVSGDPAWAAPTGGGGGGGAGGVTYGDITLQGYGLVKNLPIGGYQLTETLSTFNGYPAGTLVSADGNWSAPYVVHDYTNLDNSFNTPIVTGLSNNGAAGFYYNGTGFRNSIRGAVADRLIVAGLVSTTKYWYEYYNGSWTQASGFTGNIWYSATGGHMLANSQYVFLMTNTGSSTNAIHRRAIGAAPSTWSLVGSYPATGLLFGSYGDTLWAWGFGGKLWKSTNHGSNWSEISGVSAVTNSYYGSGNWAINKSDGTIWIGTGNGKLLKVLQDGTTTTQLSSVPTFIANLGWDGSNICTDMGVTTSGKVVMYCYSSYNRNYFTVYDPDADTWCDPVFVRNAPGYAIQDRGYNMWLPEDLEDGSVLLPATQVINNINYFSWFRLPAPA